MTTLPLGWSSQRDSLSSSSTRKKDDIMDEKEIKEELVKQVLKGDRHDLELAKDKLAFLNDSGLMPPENTWKAF